MATEGERVIGAGVLVTIAGEQRRLLFDLQALLILEDEFDGLLHFTQALNSSFRGKHLKALRAGLLAGGSWADVRPGSLEIRRLGIDATLSTLIGSPEFVPQVVVGIEAIKEAFNQAIPPASKDKRASKALGREKGSRGPASTAARSSKRASTPASSAA